jgi:hypothetical protein
MNSVSGRSFGEVLWRAEPWIVWVMGALAMASVPIALGGIGISWDGLNHHFYLGWIAQQSRFDQDFAAAPYQGYQFPYLYWPLYRLAAANASGVTAGVVLALLQSLAIPPTWLVARICCPGNNWLDLVLRILAVILAFLGAVTLSLLDSTSNDMLAVVPFLWAVALAFVMVEVPQGESGQVLVWSMLSGFCAGVAVACKLSNGPLALVLPLAWLMARGSFRQRLLRVMVAGVATITSFLLVYGYWGWQLWSHMGNPVYPFYDASFKWLRTITGWMP